MSLVHHNCPNCNQNLSFPENLHRVNCPKCGKNYFVECYQNLVTLRPDTANYQSIYRSVSNRGLLEEGLEILNSQISSLERQLIQDRLSGLSSLALALLFTAFALFGLLMERGLLALLCGMLGLAMSVIGVFALKSSAKLRTALAVRVAQRDQLLRELSPQTPKVF